MFALLYTTTVQVFTFTLLVSVRPFGRLTAKDEPEFFDRLWTTTLDERRQKAFPTYRKS